MVIYGVGGYKLVPRYLYKESVSFALMASSSSVVVCVVKKTPKKSQKDRRFPLFLPVGGGPSESSRWTYVQSTD